MNKKKYLIKLSELITTLLRIRKIIIFFVIMIFRSFAAKSITLG